MGIEKDFVKAGIKFKSTVDENNPRKVVLLPR